MGVGVGVRYRCEYEYGYDPDQVSGAVCLDQSVAFLPLVVIPAVKPSIPLPWFRVTLRIRTRLGLPCVLGLGVIVTLTAGPVHRDGRALPGQPFPHRRG